VSDTDGETLRVVVDTSVWVSAAINPVGPPGKVFDALRHRHFRLVTSEPLLRELAAVLNRRRISARYRLTPESVEQFIALLCRRAEVVAITGEPQGCRDPNDDMLIETARAGNATLLVSRDEDLTRDLDLMAAFNRYEITPLTVRRFLDLLAAE